MYERVPLKGLGWSDVHESPSLAQWWQGLQTPVKMCLEHTGGQQRCFSDAESQIAYDNNCERMDEYCHSAGPGGNRTGQVWCCQMGVPATASQLSPGYVEVKAHAPKIVTYTLGFILAFGIWAAVAKLRSKKASFAATLIPEEQLLERFI